MSTFTKAAPSSPEIPMDTDEPGPSRRSIFTPVRPVSSNEGSSPDCNTSSPSSSNDSPQDPHRQGSSSGRSGSPTQKWHFNPLFYYFSSGEGETPTFDTSTSQVQGLTRDGKVMKIMLKEGTGDQVPDEGRAWIDYICFVEGEPAPYDFTVGHYGPRSYRLGAGEMLPGVELSLLSMKMGEVSKFLIDPVYAYGKLGCPPTIPPEARIFVIMKVIRVSPDPECESSSDEENGWYNEDVDDDEHPLPDDDDGAFNLAALELQLPTN